MHAVKPPADLFGNALVGSELAVHFLAIGPLVNFVFWIVFSS